MSNNIFEFKDLQNESCTVEKDSFGNFWIGRNSFPKMNISKNKLADIFESIEKNDGHEQ